MMRLRSQLVLSAFACACASDPTLVGSPESQPEGDAAVGEGDGDTGDGDTGDGERRWRHR